MKAEDTVKPTERESERGWRVFLGSFVLLIVSYLIYFVRYPMWQSFVSVEVINVLSILSYFIVFVVALFLLKKDSKKSLSSVFKNKGSVMIVVGLAFGSLYLGLWYLISLVLGSRFEFTSFPSLRGFEGYAVFSLASAFVLYLAFSVFGAFAEEVAYRGYVQTRITSRYGYVVGIIVSTLFFSFQHIHIFQTSWLIQFFQTQFFHVMLFGIFGGYLFFKSKENIWCVFSFHVLINIFSVSVPIVVTPTFQFAYYIAEIASFMVMIMLLRYLPLQNKKP
jgi:membrane protease YdiL (CAAX protease family)